MCKKQKVQDERRLKFFIVEELLPDQNLQLTSSSPLETELTTPAESISKAQEEEV